MRRIPGCNLRAQGVCSRPQQEVDLWIGQYSFRRSLMAFPPVGLAEISCWCVANGMGSSRDGLLQCLSEGSHDKLAGVVRQLQKEKRRVLGEMERLNAALAALGGPGNLGGKHKGVRAREKRRPMSAAARKRIATAQRLRWARWKAAGRK